MRFRLEEKWHNSHSFRFFAVIAIAVSLITLWIGPPIYFDSQGWSESWVAGWVMAPAFIVVGLVIIGTLWAATE